MRAMLSVIVPTLNAGHTLVRTMTALIPATVRGLIKEVIVVDAGSTDATLDIVDASGARLVRSELGRGRQLAAGAEAARGDWLLFLHADTALEHGWEDEIETLLEQVAEGRFGTGEIAGAFRFALDDFSLSARLLERIVALRCMLFKLPYGDQGLLISRRLYARLGGFRPLPLMEDVDFVRRLKRRQLILFRSAALTSAERYLENGFLSRVLRNATCLSLYFLRVPPRFIARLYG